MNSRFRRRLIILLAILALPLALAAFFRRELLEAMGRALVIDDPLQKSDVVVLPQWAGHAGVIEAADLVHGGIADTVVLLVEPLGTADLELARRGVAEDSDAENLTRLLGRLGVANVDRITEPANGTEAEGRLLPSFCAEHAIHSIVVVSTSDHSRRIGRVLRRSIQLDGAQVVVRIRSARYSSFDPSRWWETRDGARIEVVEMEKLLLDVLRHPIS